MKKCWKCQEHKSLETFGKSLERWDGKNPACKECIKTMSAESRARNPETRKATCEKYQKANGEKCRKAQADWYAKGGKEKVKQWAAQNLEKTKAYKASWRSENYQAIAAIKAQRKGAVGKHTADEIQTLFTSQKGKCVYCHKSLDSTRHKDHIFPLKLGGSNAIGNIQLLCRKCNLRELYT